MVLPQHPFDASALPWIINAVIIVHGTNLVTQASLLFDCILSSISDIIKTFLYAFWLCKIQFKTSPHKSLFNQIVPLRTVYVGIV